MHNLPPLLILILSPHEGWYVPEADIWALQYFRHQFKARSLGDCLHAELSGRHGLVGELTETDVTTGFPHHPEFESVDLKINMLW